MRGLADKHKRKQFFVYCKTQGYNVVLMQETHATKTCQKLWHAEFGGDMIFSNDTSKSRGVAIAITNKSGVNFIKSEQDNEGRVLHTLLKCQETEVLITNIYTPNEDNELFFKEVFEKTMSYDTEHKIIAGDFNKILNIDLDAYSQKQGVTKETKSKTVILDFLEDNDWMDAWRYANPGVRQYTWSRKKPITMTRIDCCLAPRNTLAQISTCKIVPGILTDHSFIKIELNFSDMIRGRGLWKFNNSLLRDTEFVSLMNKKLEHELTDFEAPDWHFLKHNLQ